MAKDSARIENGWSLYGHPFFIGRLSELVAEVEAIAAKEPTTFHRHPAFKLLKCVRQSITVTVPADPSHGNFRQGNTLGPTNRHWMRVKKGLPDRYRLFFQFRSSAPKSIIFAWLNDDRTLRQDGARTDVYKVFCGMLESGKMPGTFDELLAGSRDIPAGL